MCCTQERRCNISNFHSNHSGLILGARGCRAAISQIFTQTTASKCLSSAPTVLQYLKFSLKPQRLPSSRIPQCRCNISNFHSNHSLCKHRNQPIFAAISQIFTQTTACCAAVMRSVALQYLKFSLKPQPPARVRRVRPRCNISNFHSNHSAVVDRDRIARAAISQFSLKPQPSASAGCSRRSCNISNFHSNHSVDTDERLRYLAAISQIFTQTTADRTITN